MFELCQKYMFIMFIYYEYVFFETVVDWKPSRKYYSNLQYM